MSLPWNAQEVIEIVAGVARSHDSENPLPADEIYRAVLAAWDQAGDPMSRKAKEYLAGLATQHEIRRRRKLAHLSRPGQLAFSQEEQDGFFVVGEGLYCTVRKAKLDDVNKQDEVMDRNHAREFAAWAHWKERRNYYLPLLRNGETIGDASPPQP